MGAAAAHLVPHTSSCSTRRPNWELAGPLRDWIGDAHDAVGEMNGGSGASLQGEHPLFPPCQHSKLCPHDARSNRVHRPTPETAQGTAPSWSPVYLSAIPNFQLGCQRIPDDGHVMFTKGNLKRKLSAMKVRGSPPLFWHPDLP